jgi:ParB family chromosome partitioning protein
MKCEHCGSRFLAERHTRKFCSTQCRQNYFTRLKRELARTEWHSPTEMVEAARTVMGGIDLDPASCAQANKIIKAEKFYSLREDGLSQPWFGRIWLNPPYGRFAPKFVKRFGELFSIGSIEQGILLLGTHHLTTEWIGVVFLHKPIICFPTKRLQFSDSKSRPAHGSVILGIGVDQDQFAEIFSEFGHLFTA